MVAPNDNFANRIVLTPGANSLAVPFDLTGSTFESGETLAGFGTGSIWYEITLPTSNYVLFDIVCTANNVILGLFNGTPSPSAATFVDLQAQPGAFGLEYRYAFLLAGGTTYYVALAGTIDGTLNVRPFGPGPSVSPAPLQCSIVTDLVSIYAPSNQHSFNDPAASGGPYTSLPSQADAKAAALAEAQVAGGPTPTVVTHLTSGSTATGYIYTVGTGVASTEMAYVREMHFPCDSAWPYSGSNPFPVANPGPPTGVRLIDWAPNPATGLVDASPGHATVIPGAGVLVIPSEDHAFTPPPQEGGYGFTPAAEVTYHANTYPGTVAFQPVASSGIADVVAHGGSSSSDQHVHGGREGAYDVAGFLDGSGRGVVWIGPDVLGDTRTSVAWYGIAVSLPYQFPDVQPWVPLDYPAPVTPAVPELAGDPQDSGRIFYSA